MEKAVPQHSNPDRKTSLKIIGARLWKSQFILRIPQSIRSNIISRYESRAVLCFKLGNHRKKNYVWEETNGKKKWEKAYQTEQGNNMTKLTSVSLLS